MDRLIKFFDQMVHALYRTTIAHRLYSESQVIYIYICRELDLLFWSSRQNFNLKAAGTCITYPLLTLCTFHHHLPPLPTSTFCLCLHLHYATWVCRRSSRLCSPSPCGPLSPELTVTWLDCAHHCPSRLCHHPMGLWPIIAWAHSHPPAYDLYCLHLSTCSF